MTDKDVVKSVQSQQKSETKRKICVVTGTRAEYGLLYWLMKEIQQNPELELQLIATGMHLSPEFGLTWKQIEEDGFFINEKVEMLLSSDTPTAIAKSIGLGIIGFADALQRLSPDIIVILGDRFEIFAAASAAVPLRIPIAHIHGGESTEGLIDEAIRHAITKMSHLHFVAAEKYRQRVIQMGEAPDKVFFVGAPGLEHLARLKLPTKNELEEILDFALQAPVFLVTYHPVTLEGNPETPFKELLCALDRFPEARIIFTLPNADTEGREIIRLIESYTKQNKCRARFFVSLGQKNYLGLLKLCDAVIGNSSSGLIEAPACGVPTINLGNRQKGRLKAGSVIDCSEEQAAIENAIRLALSPKFKEKICTDSSLYGSGNVSVSIKKILKNANLDGILQKKFYDLTNKLG